MSLMHHAFYLGCFALVGCAATDLDQADGPNDSFLAGGKADGAVEEGSADARAVLRVANGASVATLDDHVPLDARAARNIVAFRVGDDGQPGTADDRRFTTLAELDAISYVGPVAFGNLLEFVHGRTLADVLPTSSFALDVTVSIPVTTSRFNAITQSGPYNLTDTQARTRTRTLSLSSDGTTIRIATGTLGLRVPTEARLSADGRFSFSTHDSGITSDQRRVYWDDAQLSGHLDPLGELVIDGFHENAGSGNQIYGYTGVITDLTGPGFGDLPFVDGE